MNIINDSKVPSSELNRIIGHIEDIVISPTFQVFLFHFMLHLPTLMYFFIVYIATSDAFSGQPLHAVF